LHAGLLAISTSCVSATRSTTEVRPVSGSNSSAATHPISSASPELSVARQPLEVVVRAPAGIEPAPEPEPEPEPEPVRADTFEMAFVGDVIFGRYRAQGFDPIAEDGFEVFGEVTGLLRADLTIGNLETPLVHELPEKSPIVSVARFGASAEMASPLARAGFHAMGVANNHAYDLRRAGLHETPEILAELGIVALGPAHDEPPTVRVQTIERRGWRVGVLAIATRLNGRKPHGLPSIPLVPTLELAKQLGPLVKAARASHDLIVVLVHWGEEYRDTPTSAQRWAAHALVDAGVDIVVGHHPHVLQGIERYGYGVIAYSLGNFLFDNLESTQRQTGVLRVRARDHGCLDAVVFHPVRIEGEPVVHPVPATDEHADEIEARIRRLSKRWGTRWVEQGDALALLMPGCSP
jgi:poly-gamma-glutamate capsule biosynthesis protein CapA/YwtB (metallophosphatase superfamily)